MIVYQNNLENFINAATTNQIANEILETFRNKHIAGGSDAEIRSWQNSLRAVKDVLDCPEIPRDCSVAIEYNIPQTSKRVDFMIVGQDQNAKDHVVIIELKQWDKVQKVDEVSKHSVKGATSHGFDPHPSYQAFSYKSLIMNYCNVEELDSDSFNPCAYLHNMTETYRNELEDSIYSEWTKEAPVFLSEDFYKLREFIKKYINKKSDTDELLYKIDFGRIKPTKALQDSLDDMLLGNESFKMIDEQAIAYDYIMRAIRDAQKDDKKHVVIIDGGSGTGKSVIAINVLADCIRKYKLNASYITKNATPRNCYKALLSNGNARKEINLEFVIQSPHRLPGIPCNGLDVGIFDEAHRMQKKPYMYKGEDMLKDAINAARVSVFFIDDDQRVTVKDCYNQDIIKAYAKEAGAIIDTPNAYRLTSQFRCNGSDGYITFLDAILYGKDPHGQTYDISNYEIEVLDSPQELKSKIIEKDCGRNKSRMIAGYCYDWNVKNHRGEWDIIINDFKAKWNLENDNIFAINPNSINEIGCIHTVQGMEFDYAGVFIGKDLLFRNHKVVTDKSALSKDDKSSGIRGCRDDELADRLIRNTYKVLLTRGQKGCYIYCEDEYLADFIKKCIEKCKNKKARRTVDLTP